MISDAFEPENENGLLRAELEKLRQENAELKRHVQESRDWFFELFKASPGLIAITRMSDGKIIFCRRYRRIQCQSIC